MADGGAAGSSAGCVREVTMGPAGVQTPGGPVQQLPPRIILRAMPNTSTTRPDEHAGRPFLERLRAATELLEEIVADRGLLAQAPPDDQRRLLQAAGHVYAPDAVARRRLVRATIRRRKADKVNREDRVLDQTGIRTLRRQAGLHQPQRLPADRLRAARRRRRSRLPRGRSSRSTATSASRSTPTIHHFYDQLCPACAAFNFAKRTELADLRGRVALLTGGRVKIGYQAGLKLLRAGAHLIVTTRFPRDSAARYAAGAGLRRVGAPARDLRARPAPHAERGGLLPRAAGDPRPARLHHQQRLPDRAPPARVLRST